MDMNEMNSVWNGDSCRHSKNGGFQIFVLIGAAFPFWLPLLFALTCKMISWVNGNDFAAVYERNWGIELSSEWKEACRKKSDIGFHGDGFWYSIYENVSEASITEMHIPFMKEKNEGITEENRLFLAQRFS